MTGTTTNYATYIRRSTDEQDDEHQADDIREWLDRRDLDWSDVAIYREQASGASRDRNDFNQLIADIENGEYTDVVVWEVSRIARHGLLAQEFFEACERNDVTIHVTNGSVRRIEPGGQGRMVAGIIAEVAAEERRQLIRRTKAGLRRARNEGKWLGQVPTGFVRSDEGYLHPNLSPDYDAGETGFLDVQEALEAVEEGESYRSAADQLPNCSRQTLMNIHKDDDRRRWYLHAKADDEAVQQALADVSPEAAALDANPEEFTFGDQPGDADAP